MRLGLFAMATARATRWRMREDEAQAPEIGVKHGCQATKRWGVSRSGQQRWGKPRNVCWGWSAAGTRAAREAGAS